MKKVLRTLVICLSLCLFLTISVKVYADDEIVTSDDGIIVSDENEPAVTSIEENNTTTSTDIKIIKSGKGWKKYSGKVGTVDGFDGLCDVYKVKVGKDFSLSIAEYKDSDIEGGYLAVYDNIGDAQKSDGSDAGRIAAIYIDGGSVENLNLKKGTYYIVVRGGEDLEYEFEAEVKVIEHIKYKWTIAEGKKTKIFDQNTALHITFEITNDATAVLDSDTYWSAPGRGNSNAVKVSDDGKKCEFTFTTGKKAAVETITLYVKEFNPKDGSDITPYTLDIMTGVSVPTTELETGSDYIRFLSFKASDSGSGKKANITVYLKKGKKWIKKFTIEAGSSEAKTISQLKANTTYQYKIVVEKTLSNGKTAKASKTEKVKTGPKAKPLITSAKVTDLKTKKVWVPGHSDENRVWHEGYYQETTTYTLTVTLKTKLTGCKGLIYEGIKSKGTGTVFTFKCVGQPASKVKVRGYSDDKLGGYTAYSNQVSISQ